MKARDLEGIDLLVRRWVRIVGTSFISLLRYGCAPATDAGIDDRNVEAKRADGVRKRVHSARVLAGVEVVRLQFRDVDVFELDRVLTLEGFCAGRWREAGGMWCISCSEKTGP